MVWVASFTLVCGMVMEANVMAEITDIMQAMGRRFAKKQDIIDMVNTNMKDLKLTKEIQI